VSVGNRVLFNHPLSSAQSSVTVKSLVGQQFFLRHYIEEEIKYIEWWVWATIGVVCGSLIITFGYFIGHFLYFKYWKKPSQNEVEVLQDFNKAVGTGGRHRHYLEPNQMYLAPIVIGDFDSDSSDSSDSSANHIYEEVD
ncbi:unnamed protein product, partial [Meganyctiphanes norvegica]